MSVTINSSPPAIGLIGNGINFRITGESFIQSLGGSGSWGLLVDSFPLVAGDWIDLWDFDKAEKFRITVATTPDEELNQIPVSSTIQAVVDSLVKLYLVNKFYSVFGVNPNFLYFVPRSMQALTWSSMADFSSNFSLSSSTDGYEQVYQPDYSIYCSVAYFNTNYTVNIAELILQPDEDGICNIDISKLLKYFASVDKPALDTFSVDNSNIIKYEVLFGEKYDVSAIQRVNNMSLFRGFVLNGKVDNNGSLYSLIYDIENNFIFLNHLRQTDVFAESVYFLNYHNPIDVIDTEYIKFKLYYTDLTDVTETVLTESHDPNACKIKSFPVGIDQLSLNSYNPTKEIYKYQVWVNRIEFTPSAVGVTIITGTHELFADSNLFSAGDVGKTIKIAGAGVAAVDLIATITSYISNVDVEISVNASTSVTNTAALSFGADVVMAGPVNFNVIEKPMFVREFCFLNKYGVYEFFHAVTKSDTVLEVKKDIVQKADNSVDDLFDESHNIIKCNTGTMPSADALEMQYFLYSNDFYEIINLEYIKCIIEPGTFQIIEESSNTSFIEFSYRKANNL